MCGCSQTSRWMTISQPACRCAPARSCTRHSRAIPADEAPAGRSSTGGALHRLRALHRRLSGGRDRRGARSDAYRGRRLVHRLRALPAALPGRLHRHVAARERMDAGVAPRGRRARHTPAQATGKERSALAWRGRAQGNPRCAPRAQMNPQKRRQIYERFRAANPYPTTELKYRTPYELLVAVVLSAQATDKSVNQASGPLFAKYDTPEKMAKLGVAGLERYIKTIGLYRNKAKNVIALSKILIEQHGGEIPRSREALEALPGVGRKTANVVLNTAFGEDRK